MSETVAESRTWAPGGPHDRDAAWRLVCEHTRSESLRIHMLCVAASLRACARQHGEDADLWEVLGLLHDMDYEENPDLHQHALVGPRMLREAGWPEVICRAIESHNDAHDIPRVTLTEHALYACDEISGFVYAVALVKGRDIGQVEVASVKKKLKDKGFARNVSREDVERGFGELDVEPDEHIAMVIAALRESADQLGLVNTAG
ncbi:MAG TPA: HDIG domain-containing protein [Candidatus Dormibacteraeota bacterium]|nr:HDIG domain-containing protein [Candidatus Dormibacteraeota bacterium]